MIHDGLWDVYNDDHMVNTGESVATEFDISRSDADGFAARSQQRASEASGNGWFDWELFDVEVLQRRGDPVYVKSDEGVRPGTTAEGLSQLRPALKKDVLVTAGKA